MNTIETKDLDDNKEEEMEEERREKEMKQLRGMLATFTFHGRKIPSHMHNALVSYFIYHSPVGGFLTAVLENDLKKAVSRADYENIEVLHVYVAFFRNYVSLDSYGSVKAVEAWVKG